FTWPVAVGAADLAALAALATLAGLAGFAALAGFAGLAPLAGVSAVLDFLGVAMREKLPARVNRGGVAAGRQENAQQGELARDEFGNHGRTSAYDHQPARSRASWAISSASATADLTSAFTSHAAFI